MYKVIISMINIYFYNWLSNKKYPTFKKENNIILRNQSFWASKTTYFFLYIIKKYIDKDIFIIPKNQYKKYNIDILFVSVFGNKNKIIQFIKNNNIKCKIFFSGENLYYYHQNYKCYLIDYCNICTGVNNIVSKNFFYFPFYILLFFNINQYNIDFKNLNINTKLVNFYPKKKKNICMISGNPGDGQREFIFNELIKHFEIDSCGRLCNNYKSIGKGSYNKIKFLSNYKFNICFENSNNKNYVTEKIYESILSGCIPIYYGNEGNTPPFINEKFIIHYKKNNLNDVIEKIKKICSSEYEYKKFFNVEKIYIKKMQKYIYNYIKKIIILIKIYLKKIYLKKKYY
jgi:alpha(1,3/1,4) fucosyltransferase